MPLWKNVDFSSGNNKPLFANTTNVWSESTIHGEAANTAAYYGVVFGVSALEQANTAEGRKVTHAGWVSQKIGTGPIVGVSFSTPGSGVNANGYFAVTDTSVYGKGTSANISYFIANSQNTLQNYSSNAQLNVINSIVVNNGGTLYSDPAKISLALAAAAISNPTLTIKLGGRGGRTQYETLVAMGSITGDDPRDNSTFSGI